jgi:hypothetical protein
MNEVIMSFFLNCPSNGVIDSKSLLKNYAKLPIHHLVKISSLELCIMDQSK